MPVFKDTALWENPTLLLFVYNLSEESKLFFLIYIDKTPCVAWWVIISKSAIEQKLLVKVFMAASLFNRR